MRTLCLMAVVTLGLAEIGCQVCGQGTHDDNGTCRPDPNSDEDPNSDSGVDMDSGVNVGIDLDSGVAIDLDFGVNIDLDSDVNIDLDSDVNVESDSGADMDVGTDPEILWAELLALDGMHWAYRARNTYTDGGAQTSGNDPVLFFQAIGNNIPTPSTLEWKGGYDYSVEQVWYADFGPRPAYIDRGGGDQYVRFINGLASNFETEPGQLSPREAMGEDFHFIHCFRTMPGAHYEGSVTGGLSWKDRMGDGEQIGLAVQSDFVLGPSGKVTRWGEDNIVDIRLWANGDAEFWLNGERIIEHNFPSLVEKGLHEFILGTNSHVMSNHFRAAMFKRGGLFTEAELAVIYDKTHALWPRGQLPSFPYLDGAYPNRSTTWNRDTKTWAPSTGGFSGGNGEEGAHRYQWYYWDRNATVFSRDNPLRSHLPIPGATHATLTRTDYEAGNTRGHEVIFDDLHDGHVRVMRLITPLDSSGAEGESLSGAWAHDNIP
jgi:hypothetical protein